MKHSYYEQGSWKSLCDICGRAYKGTDLRMQWDNAMACYRCYDTKHPDLEPIIAPNEDPMVPDARPRPEFANLTFVDVEGLSAWGGVMDNGYDLGTEWTWEGLDITWEEQSVAEDFDFN